MARRKSAGGPGPVPAAPAEARRCSGCAHAYGWCDPARDGRPVSCRCHLLPGRLLMCSERACGRWERGTAPVPSRVTEARSVDLHASEVRPREVPLFRPGGRLPWRWVPVTEMPPGGLLSDGTPAVGAAPVGDGEGGGGAHGGTPGDGSVGGHGADAGWGPETGGGGSW